MCHWHGQWSGRVNQWQWGKDTAPRRHTPTMCIHSQTQSRRSHQNLVQCRPLRAHRRYQTTLQTLWMCILNLLHTHGSPKLENHLRRNGSTLRLPGPVCSQQPWLSQMRPRSQRPCRTRCHRPCFHRRLDVPNNQSTFRKFRTLSCILPSLFPPSSSFPQSLLLKEAGRLRASALT